MLAVRPGAASTRSRRCATATASSSPTSATFTGDRPARRAPRRRRARSTSTSGSSTTAGRSGRCAPSCRAARERAAGAGAGSPPTRPPRCSRLLAHPNIATKADIIRRYDHEIRGATVVRPLIGVAGDAPADGVVVARPSRPTRPHGIAIGIGVNPWYGELDPERMAHAVVDEAIRNVVAVGADPDRVALLDNFSWGDPRRATTLGDLVAAVKGCCDAARRPRGPVRQRQGLAQQRVHRRRRRTPRRAADARHHRRRPRARRRPMRHPGPEAGRQRRRCSSGARAPSSAAATSTCSPVPAEVPATRRPVPAPDPNAPDRYRRLHRADRATAWSRAAHDCSEGGLAVALAEMAIGGRLGLCDRHVARRRPGGLAVRRVDRPVRARGRTRRRRRRGRRARRAGDAARHRHRRAHRRPARLPRRSPSPSWSRPSPVAGDGRMSRPVALDRRAPPARTAIATSPAPSTSPAPRPRDHPAGRAARRPRAARRGPDARGRRRLLLRRRPRRRPAARPRARPPGSAEALPGVRRRRPPGDRHLQRLPGAGAHRPAARSRPAGRPRTQRHRPLRVPLGAPRAPVVQRCVWTARARPTQIECPIAHGEGRFACDPDTLAALRAGDRDRPHLRGRQPQRIDRRTSPASATSPASCSGSCPTPRTTSSPASTLRPPAAASDATGLGLALFEQGVRHAKEL